LAIEAPVSAPTDGRLSAWFDRLCADGPEPPHFRWSADGTPDAEEAIDKVQKGETPRRLTMSIHDKIVSFAIMEAGWVTWLLIGFSMGGIGVAVARAITLIRGSAMMRRLSERRRPHPSCDRPSALALSSSW